MKNIVIIVGAGRGKRMGFQDKAFLKLGKETVLYHSILPFEALDTVDEIYLVMRKEKVALTKKLIAQYKFKKIKKIIVGGKERQDSIYNAIKEINHASFVFIHDIARPLVNKKLISKCLDAVKKYKSVIPALPPKETVKTGSSFIEKTISRNSLWLAQTPQVFDYKIIKEAYLKADRDNFIGTDDASLVERLGKKVKIIPGFAENIKITVPTDLMICETFIKAKI